MKWKDRQENILPYDDSSDRTLHFLYSTAAGRFILHLMIKPWVSCLAGRLMDSRVSKLFVKGFVKKNRIRMEDYEEREFCSFNDFFTRRVKEGKRPIDMCPDHFIAPCDSKLTAYRISPDASFLIKGTEYTMDTLLQDEKLAARFDGGRALIFRLTVGDYHRYCYPDSGTKTDNIHINGVYYTVNPIANGYKIYKENTREYCLLTGDSFGDMIMMEVGATMVGRIVNRHGAQRVTRGQEKGMFEFGGSTVIVFVQKDRLTVDGDILENTQNGFETVVKMGEKIGIREGQK